MAAGSYELVFDATRHGGQAGGLASGVYFFRLTSGNFARTKSLILLH